MTVGAWVARIDAEARPLAHRVVHRYSPSLRCHLDVARACRDGLGTTKPRASNQLDGWLQVNIDDARSVTATVATSSVCAGVWYTYHLKIHHYLLLKIHDYTSCSRCITTHLYKVLYIALVEHTWLDLMII